MVDSSCFPSVPGGAITFTAMANSHRIARAVRERRAVVIAVTGANGYVGGRILAALRDARSRHGRARAPSPGVRGALPPVRARRAARRGRPSKDVDTVIHAAWDASARGGSVDAVNVRGSLPLLDAVTARGGQVVLVSSLSSFSRARSRYGAAKYALEQAVQRHGGLAIRPGLVFGIGAGGLFGNLAGDVLGRRR